jgi:hypothetical protein
MKSLINLSWPMRLAAVLTAGAVSIAAVDIAEARGMGGSTSHSSHSLSTLPEKHGNGYQSSGHLGSKHEGKEREGKKHEGKEHGCRKNCQGGKNAIVVTDGNGKILYRGPGGNVPFSAKAVPGGIALQIGGKSVFIPGKSVAVKNEALSNAAAQQGGLTQTIKRNSDGTVSAVLTVTPLKGL